MEKTEEVAQRLGGPAWSRPMCDITFHELSGDTQSARLMAGSVEGCRKRAEYLVDGHYRCGNHKEMGDG